MNFFVCCIEKFIALYLVLHCKHVIVNNSINHWVLNLCNISEGRKSLINAFNISIKCFLLLWQYNISSNYTPQTNERANSGETQALQTKIIVYISIRCQLWKCNKRVRLHLQAISQYLVTFSEWVRKTIPLRRDRFPCHIYFLCAKTQNYCQCIAINLIWWHAKYETEKNSMSNGNEAFFGALWKLY